MKVLKEVTFIERDAIKDRENGGMKNKFHKIGVIFEKPNGKQIMKLDSIPVNFNGWLNLIDPFEETEISIKEPEVADKAF